jgi:hypothetical protein
LNLKDIHSLKNDIVSFMSKESTVASID